MNLALLLSGGGTTAERIIQECKGGVLQGMNPVLVVASKDTAGGIEKAKALGVEVVVIRPKDFDNPLSFGEKIIDECRKRSVDIIGQYGWMTKTPPNVIEAYEGRMINQHPGPLDIGHPDFGGVGMYGMRVHAARLCFAKKTGDFWTEATAQRVAKDFDEGAVLEREKVLIEEGDTPETLSQRVLPIEHEVQVRALKAFLDGNVVERERQERLVKEEHLLILEECKKEGIERYPRG